MALYLQIWWVMLYQLYQIKSNPESNFNRYHVTFILNGHLTQDKHECKIWFELSKSQNSQGKIAKRNSRRISYIYIGKEHFQLCSLENNKKAWPKTFGDCLKSLYSIAQLYGKIKSGWINIWTNILHLKETIFSILVISILKNDKDWKMKHWPFQE